jgi:hypothetical protein
MTYLLTALHRDGHSASLFFDFVGFFGGLVAWKLFIHEIFTSVGRVE